MGEGRELSCPTFRQPGVVRAYGGAGWMETKDSIENILNTVDNDVRGIILYIFLLLKKK